MRRTTVGILCTLIFVTCYAKAPILSKQVLQARYVALGYETANGFLGEWDYAAIVSAKVLPQDREALANVRDALKKWNRYYITVEPQQAEMLIAVRSGRTASASGGVRIGAGSIDPTGRTTRGIGVGPKAGVEAGPADDYLAVYQSDEGREGPQLWREARDGGLNGKDPALFESFRKDVERLEKSAGPKKP